MKRVRSINRRGVATAEFALCLPILVILIFGINEVCSAIYLKEQVTIAAYEGARIGIQRGTTDTMVEDFVHDFLDERNITYDEDAAVVISTPGFSNSPTMGHVTTTVTVPVAGNSLSGGFFTDHEISASVVLRKEFEN